MPHQLTPIRAAPGGSTGFRRCTRPESVKTDERRLDYVREAAFSNDYYCQSVLITFRAVKALTGKLTSMTASQQGPVTFACPLSSGPTIRHVTGSYSSASQRIVAPPCEVALTSRCRSAAMTQVRFAGFGCNRLSATIFDSRGHPGSGTGSHPASPALKLHVDREISVRASGGRGRGQSGITVVHGSGPVLGKGGQVGVEFSRR